LNAGRKEGNPAKDKHNITTIIIPFYLNSQRGAKTKTTRKRKQIITVEYIYTSLAHFQKSKKETAETGQPTTQPTFSPGPPVSRNSDRQKVSYRDRVQTTKTPTHAHKREPEYKWVVVAAQTARTRKEVLWHTAAW
jgi:hypothetical protein